MPSTPYMSWLGIVFDRFEPDDVTIRLPFREDLKNTDGNVVAQPGTNANPPASSPVYCSWSVPHSPQACTRTSASSSPTAGREISWSTRRRGRSSTNARALADSRIAAP